MRSLRQPLVRGALCVATVAPLTACFYDSNPGVTGDAAPATTGVGATGVMVSGATTDAASTTEEALTVDSTLTPLETGTAPDLTTTGPDPTVTTLTLPDETSTTAPCVPLVWYLDVDNDGYGATDQTTMACEQPPGYVPVDGDCAPMDGNNSPGLLELCDGQDNDCDAGVDEYSPMNLACAGCRAVLGDPRVYYLCSNLRDWTAARAACQAYGPGADLVVLHSGPEQDLLVNQISMVANEAASPWWLGLSDIDVEGTFVWIDTSGLDFSAWQPGEPNQQGEEDCVQFPAGFPGQWNDLDCATANFYICEGPQ